MSKVGSSPTGVREAEVISGMRVRMIASNAIHRNGDLNISEQAITKRRTQSNSAKPG